MIRSAVITSLVIIDSTVADYQSLIAGLVPGAEAIVLERDRDGVEQITEALANYSDLKSVHIVSLTLSHWDTT
jgi:large repetitive protein